MSCQCQGKCCVWTGLPCDCNDVEAYVNCPHNPQVPSVDPEFDSMGEEPDWDQAQRELRG